MTTGDITGQFTMGNYRQMPDYRETARKLRAKAEDKATPESERAVLLAKAGELEDKYGKDDLPFLRVPPYVHAWRPGQSSGPFKSPGFNAMFEDLVEDIYREDDGPHIHDSY